MKKNIQNILICLKKINKEGNMTEADESVQKITIPDTITVKDLAENLSISSIEIIKELMKNGVMATINQVIDFDTAAIVVSDLGYDAIENNKEVKDENQLNDSEDKRNPFKSLRINMKETVGAIPRHPVVTVIGHVDHGKTTLLDKIRQSNIVSSEVGNITQSIAAYQAKSPDGRLITFIDTPGHAAFTNMRKRGAQITDVAIIVIAADDGIMPQTKEVINFIKEADIPMIVAINKTDLKDISTDRVKQQLMEMSLTPEEYGGDLVVVNISALTGKGIDELLETTQLIADLQELKAKTSDSAEGIILEARMHKNQGILSTIIIQNGTLHKGNIIIAENTYGKVKSMVNDLGENIQSAGPSEPIIISGLSEMPKAGEKFRVIKSEKEAKKIIDRANRIQDKNVLKNSAIISEVTSVNNDSTTEIKSINLIIKSDTQGTIEPILKTIDTFKKEDLIINIIEAGIGSINESDVSLASVSKSAILGFNSRTEIGAEKLAEQEKVSITTFDIIYDLRESIEILINDVLGPIITTIEVGKLEVRKIFKMDKTEAIAGSYVLEGKINKGDNVKIIRNDEIIHESKIANIKRESDDVTEVNAGIECGIKLSNFNDFEENDQIIAFQINEQKREI
jgi:translation initiation factor IF-2